MLNSYSSTSGAASSNWETTSGGVRIAATAKLPKITYGRQRRRLRLLLTSQPDGLEQVRKLVRALIVK